MNLWESQCKLTWSSVERSKVEGGVWGHMGYRLVSAAWICVGSKCNTKKIVNLDVV